MAKQRYKAWEPDTVTAKGSTMEIQGCGDHSCIFGSTGGGMGTNGGCCCLEAMGLGREARRVRRNIQLLRGRVAESELAVGEGESERTRLRRYNSEYRARVAELEAQREPRPMPNPNHHPKVQALVTLEHRGYGPNEEEWEDIEGNPFSLDLCDGWLPLPDERKEGE